MTWWALQNVYTKAFVSLIWPTITTHDRRQALVWFEQSEAEKEIDRLEDPDAWIAVEE